MFKITANNWDQLFSIYLVIPPIFRALSAFKLQSMADNCGYCPSFSDVSSLHCSLRLSFVENKHYKVMLTESEQTLQHS